MWLYPTASFPSAPELGIKGIEQTQEEENVWVSAEGRCCERSTECNLLQHARRSSCLNKMQF